MSLGALCDAAVRSGDSTAANLLLGQLGGPQGLDAALEEIGDDVPRIERRETQLNQWSRGATRDTSTPRALANDLRAYVLEDVLGKAERAQLTKWLRSSATGAELIKAGMPKDMGVGNRAGAGGTYGIRNDMAVVWPSDSAPIVVAIMSNGYKEDADYDDRLIAEAASVVAGALLQQQVRPVGVRPGGALPGTRRGDGCRGRTPRGVPRPARWRAGPTRRFVPCPPVRPPASPRPPAPGCRRTGRTG